MSSTRSSLTPTSVAISDRRVSTSPRDEMALTNFPGATPFDDIPEEDEGSDKVPEFKLEVVPPSRPRKSLVSAIQARRASASTPAQANSIGLQSSQRRSLPFVQPSPAVPHAASRQQRSSVVGLRHVQHGGRGDVSEVVDPYAVERRQFAGLPTTPNAWAMQR